MRFGIVAPHLHVIGRKGERLYPAVADFAAVRRLVAVQDHLPMLVDRLLASALCGFARALTGVRALWLGSAPDAGPRVYFANHRSHGDFVLIWASLPPPLRRRTRPVAGADYWLTTPLRRFLINRVFRGVCIDRRPGRSGPNPVEQMGEALTARESLILFPEGTSSDGTRVLEFKSTLFSIAVPEEVRDKITVQPISIAYTHLDGMPLNRHLRPFFAWYGDMSLIPHLYRMAGIGRIHVTLNFHPSVSPTAIVPTAIVPTALASRKALSDYCQKQVVAGLRASLAGEDAGLAPLAPK
mgnify:CR=1 FL=1